MNQAKKATIRDVARLAGVSTATVSHVINGTHYVSPELAARVTQAIELLEYRPNRLAKALSSRDLPMIALVVPDISNPYWSSVTRAIQSVADPHGFSVIVCSTDGVLDREIRFLHTLSGWVSGLLLHPYHITHEHVSKIMTKDFPVVILGDFIAKDPLPGTWDRVGGSNCEGAFIATNHLIEIGHRRIAFVQGSKKTPSSIRRQEGYQMALEQAGISIEEKLIKYGNYTQNGGRRATQQLLDQEDPPSAVFCANDLSAFGALEAAHLEEVMIPADLSIVGYDDIDQAAYSEPPLTTIRQSPASLGEIGATKLLERIDQGRTEPVSLSLEISLVVRASTAPFPFSQ